MSDNSRDEDLRAEPAVVDERLTDPGFLVNADAEQVVALLDDASSPAARSAAAVYRASARLHRHSTAGVRRQLLALDAALCGDRELSAEIVTVRVEGEPAERWGVEWATGCHTDAVYAVATAVVEGRPVAVTGGYDGTVRVWDLTTGQPAGEPLTGHTSAVYAVATAVVEGRPVAVTGGYDETVRVWDLTTGQPAGEPLTGHTDAVYAVATAVVEGRPVAVTGSLDETVRVWDLTTCQLVGEPLTGHTSAVTSVATAVVEGRPVAVTGGHDRTVRVWDLTSREQIGKSLTGHTSVVYTVATAVVDGRVLALTGSGDDFFGFGDDFHGEMRVWDLVTHEQVGEPFAGHAGTVFAVTTVTVDGRVLALTGSGSDFHGEMRVWDVIAHEQVGPELVFPGTVYALGGAPGGRLVAGFGQEFAALTSLCSGRV
ncbi:hypothetical protein [Streptomyces sp. NPDC053720]|uniref:hypothetical protein n=1 Tax=Streptomyces sp. NPDC053720 TaxID=3154855 RepID=UPI0034496056